MDVPRFLNRRFLRFFFFKNKYFQNSIVKRFFSTNFANYKRKHITQKHSRTVMYCLNINKKNIKKTFNYHTEKHRFRLYWLVSMLINLMPFSSLWAQHSDKELFEKFESHFALFDSLIFQVHPIKVASNLDWPADYTGKSINQHFFSIFS